ncbi:MAG: hypothetical protein ACLTBV_34075 [Enterocloster bolteae]
MGLDNDCRINTPHRGHQLEMAPLPGQMSDPLVKTISSVTLRYGRWNWWYVKARNQIHEIWPAGD